MDRGRLWASLAGSRPLQKEAPCAGSGDGGGHLVWVGVSAALSAAHTLLHAHTPSVSPVQTGSKSVFEPEGGVMVPGLGHAGEACWRSGGSGGKAQQQFLSFPAGRKTTGANFRRTCGTVRV